MSDTNDDIAAGQSWWVRSASNGDIFGPVDSSQLEQWARESRVFPEDAVSADRRNWRTARTMPQLKMDTVIATSDGRIHGPLHAVAAAALVEKGKLPPGAKIFSAQDLFALDLEAQASPDGQESEELKETLERLKRDTEDAIAEKDREIETLRAAAEEADAAKAESDAAKSELTASLEKANASIALLSDEIRVAKESIIGLQAAKSETEAVKAEVEAAKAEVETAKAAAETAKAEAETVKAEAETAKAEAEAAKAGEEEAKKAFDAIRGEMAELVDFSNARDRESKATIAELERRISEISLPDVPQSGADETGEGNSRLVQALQNQVTDLSRERCSLSEKLAAAEAALAVAQRPLDADTALVKKFADEALEALRAAFEAEKARNDAERTASVQRQNDLHEHIAGLERALRLNPGEKSRSEMAEERSERTISQLRQQLDALREQHKADLGRSGENVRELEGRLQALQHREAAVREQLRRVEKRTADYDSLTSQLRRREEEIVEAEKQFGEARTQWQIVEQTLRRRIDELEHGAGSLFENEAAGQSADPSQKLVLPGWVRNMK
ncbi:MAG: hypothetical protein IJS46_03220 [Kiritimatiellae bacterium]|nr:hypothetical protein [Kiritimatiellia bacterium]